MGSGLALFDYDLDSDLDVYFVSGSTLERLAKGEPNRLFRNDGGFQFTDVTEHSGLGDRGFGQGVAVADVDNDGDEDVYVTNYGRSVLYRNGGDGTFSAWTAGVEHRAGGRAPRSPTSTTTDSSTSTSATTSRSTASSSIGPSRDGSANGRG
jgi:hypothetical protein